MATLPSRGSVREDGRATRGYRLPGAASVPQVPATRDPGVQAPAAAFGALEGRALQGLGRDIGDVTQTYGEMTRRFAIAERARQKNELVTQGLQQLTALQGSFENDYANDPARFRDRFNKGADKILAELSKRTDDDAVREAFATEFAAKRFAFEQDVIGTARKRVVDRGKASLVNGLSTLTDLYAGATTDEQREDIRGQADITIADAAVNGIITREDAAKRRLSWLSDTEATLARQMILADPEMAADELTAGDRFQNLDEDRRLSLLTRATTAAEREERARVRTAEKAERDAEKALKQQAEDLAKDGDALLSQGQLTTKWIEANRDTLDESDVRYFYKALQDEDAQATDPVIYADLRERAGTGEDVREEAKAAYTAGQIKRGDYDRLAGLSEGGLIEGQLPSWFKRGDSYIRNALAVGDAVDDPFGRLRLAEAYDDWHRWARDHANASEADAEKAYQRITAEHALVNFQDSIAVMPLPRYLPAGLNRSQVDVGAIDAAEMALYEAWNGGEIEQADYERQAELLERWRNAVEAKDRATQ